MCVQEAHQVPEGAFVEIRSKKTGRLLLRFDPKSDMIHVKDVSRHVDEMIDLSEYRNSES